MSSSTENLLAWLAAAANEHPGQPALLGQGDSLRYRELWRGLGRWSRTLSDAGLTRGAATAVLSRSRMRVARAVWLGIYAGFPVLPLRPIQPAVAELLAQCGIRQVIADGDLDLPTGLRRLPSARLDHISDGPVRGPEPLAPEKPQLLITSSGTSGPPRAAMLTGANLVTSAATTSAELRLVPDDVWLACVPLSHIAGLMILLRCARVGATALIHEAFDPAAIWRCVDASLLTRLSLAPSMLAQVLDASDDRPPSRVRTLLVGGAPLAADLARRAAAAGWPLRSTYGMTETASHVALSGSDPGNPGLRALPGTRVDIVDDAGKPGPDSGWVRITGPTVMAGYANAELRPGDGLDGPASVISKDIGRLDGNGRLRVIGRGDDVLISGGLKIHPSEVEAMLVGCPGIREAAVTGVPDAVWGRRLVALYVGDAPEDEVSQWAADHVPGMLRPRALQRVAALPRNRLGKLDRDALLPLLHDAALRWSDSGEDET